ncbi:hypothetical protein C2W58_02606 [Bacillus pumilus]|nr:hypothetical protein C2W58_02606 [Bacillus pumilus]
MLLEKNNIKSREKTAFYHSLASIIAKVSVYIKDCYTQGTLRR